jgi:hypothetical protein
MESSLLLGHGLGSLGACWRGLSQQIGKHPVLMAGSSYAVVDRRAVAAARHERHPTNSVGEPASSTPQAGRTLNPYCLTRHTDVDHPDDDPARAQIPAEIAPIGPSRCRTDLTRADLRPSATRPRPTGPQNHPEKVAAGP